MFADGIQPIGEIRLNLKESVCHSVESEWGNHGELGNVHLHGGAIHHAFHQVGAYHFANARFEVAAGNVLVCLAGFEHGLLAYHTFTFHFALGEPGIKDMPVSAEELDGVFAVVFDGNAVGKHVVVLARAGICRLVFRLYTYLDTLGDFRYHTVQKY